jgi:hypothetical protein
MAVCIGSTGCSLSSKEGLEDTVSQTTESSDIKETEETNDPVENLVMVKAIDTKNNLITVDKLELIFADDEERLAEIGKKKEDLETEYYIYNEDSELESISFDKTVPVELLDEARLVSASIEELEELLTTREVLCNVVTKDNVVIDISEQYLP